MKKSLENFIRKFVREYKKKNKTFSDWQEPLIAYADARDPLFEDLREAFGNRYDVPIKRLISANTVISIFIPFEEATTVSNREGRIASRQWAFAYVETTRLMKQLTTEIRDRLQAKGYETLLSPSESFEREIIASDYSQRYTAYIAGMGTFGHNNMLITEKGCAGRFASVITELKIQPTPRMERELCRHKHDGTCQACVDACPQGALLADGFDKRRCVEHLQENQKIYRDLGDCSVFSKCISNAVCNISSPIRIARQSAE